MTRARLSEARLARIREGMQGYVDGGATPGLVTAISRRGESHIDALGVAALEGVAPPMARDTLFRISSMTKPITAVAALILVEECRLRLDEPVGRLLPELASPRVLKRPDGPLDDTVPATRPITVRHLLSFTLGTGIVMAAAETYPIQRAMTEACLGQGPPAPGDVPPPDEWIRRLGALPLIHQPGERWMYNIGSDVLGVLIQRATGMPFEVFLRERIFEPLGMRDTGFFVPEAARGRFATSYLTDPQTGALKLYDAPAGQWSKPPAFPAGGAGLVSSVDDLLTFGRMLLGGGQLDGVRILARPTVEMLASDQLTPAQKAASEFPGDFFANFGWGFGVGVTLRRLQPFDTVGAYGWSGGLGTMLRMDPQEQMVTLVLTQAAWTSPIPPNLFLDFLTLAYQAIDD